MLAWFDFTESISHDKGALLSGRDGVIEQHDLQSDKAFVQQFCSLDLTDSNKKEIMICLSI